MPISFGRFSLESHRRLQNLLASIETDRNEIYNSFLEDTPVCPAVKKIFRHAIKDRASYKQELDDMIADCKNGSTATQQSFLAKILRVESRDITTRTPNTRDKTDYLNRAPPMQFFLAGKPDSTKNELIERYNILRYLAWLEGELNALGDFYSSIILICNPLENPFHSEENRTETYNNLAEIYKNFFQRCKTGDEAKSESSPFAKAATSLCGKYISSNNHRIRINVELLPSVINEIHLDSIKNISKTGASASTTRPSSERGAGPTKSKTALEQIKKHAENLKLLNSTKRELCLLDENEDEAFQKGITLESICERAAKAESNHEDLKNLVTELSQQPDKFSYFYQGRNKSVFSHRNWWENCLWRTSKTEDKINAWIKAVTAPRA